MGFRFLTLAPLLVFPIFVSRVDVAPDICVAEESRQLMQEEGMGNLDEILEP